MDCPDCKNKLRCVDTRQPAPGLTQRIYFCASCDKKFRTSEVLNSLESSGRVVSERGGGDAFDEDDEDDIVEGDEDDFDEEEGDEEDEWADWDAEYGGDDYDEDDDLGYV
jgi:hypothetical protein